MRITHEASPERQRAECTVLGCESAPVDQVVYLNGQLMLENVDYRFDAIAKCIHFTRKMSGDRQRDQVVTILAIPGGLGHAHITNVRFVV